MHKSELQKHGTLIPLVKFMFVIITFNNPTEFAEGNFNSIVFDSYQLCGSEKRKPSRLPTADLLQTNLATVNIAPVFIYQSNR